MIRKKIRTLARKWNKPPVVMAAALVASAAIAWTGLFSSWSEIYRQYTGPMETILVFYGNSELDPELTCDRVFPVERRVRAGTPWAAVEALLAGPTDEEKEKGYFMSNNAGVDVQDVDIWNKTAYLEFDEDLTEGIAGSCHAIAIRAEIEATAEQFPDIDKAVISSPGDGEELIGG